jgi:hypothetical protein
MMDKCPKHMRFRRRKHRKNRATNSQIEKSFKTAIEKKEMGVSFRSWLDG